MSRPRMSTAICRNTDDNQHRSSWAAEDRTDCMCCIRVCVRVSVAPRVKADRPRCLFNLIRGCHPLMSAQWISKRKLHLLTSCEADFPSEMSGVLRKQAFIRHVIWADFRAHSDYVIVPYLSNFVYGRCCCQGLWINNLAPNQNITQAVLQLKYM